MCKSSFSRTFFGDVCFSASFPGKTHTIQGTREDSGLLYRAVADLFQMVAEQSDKSDSPLFHIWVSYLEIYNEKMFDLLVDPFSESNSTSSTLPTFSSSSTHQSKSDTLSAAFCAAREASSSSLRLQVDKHDNVCVVGLKEMQVSSPEEAHVLLRRGQKNRAMAETMTNQQSSRSHCVVSIKLTKRNGDPWSKLSVVDLAGSERVERTLNRGKRLKESVKINSSLMVLGRCLETLRWNQQHSNKNQQVLFLFVCCQILIIFECFSASLFVNRSLLAFLPTLFLAGVTLS